MNYTQCAVLGKGFLIYGRIHNPYQQLRMIAIHLYANKLGNMRLSHSLSNAKKLGSVNWDHLHGRSLNTSLLLVLVRIVFRIKHSRPMWFIFNFQMVIPWRSQNLEVRSWPVHILSGSLEVDNVKTEQQSQGLEGKHQDTNPWPNVKGAVYIANWSIQVIIRNNCPYRRQVVPCSRSGSSMPGFPNCRGLQQRYDAEPFTRTRWCAFTTIW